MRLFSRTVLPAGLLALLAAGPTWAAPAATLGHAPSPATCKSHPTDPVIQGGCLVIDRSKGNCMACHAIAGTTLDGNIGPALRDVKHMVPNKQWLFNQISDPEKNNPNTAMPPFGKDRILTKQEIQKVVDFLWTL